MSYKTVIIKYNTNPYCIYKKLKLMCNRALHVLHPNNASLGAAKMYKHTCRVNCQQLVQSRNIGSPGRVDSIEYVYPTLVISSWYLNWSPPYSICFIFKSVYSSTEESPIFSIIIISKSKKVSIIQLALMIAELKVALSRWCAGFLRRDHSFHTVGKGTALQHAGRRQAFLYISCGLFLLYEL